jgi:hypothetical protein
MGFLKKSEEKLKKAGKKLGDEATDLGHKTVEVGKEVGHGVVDVAEDVGHAAVEGGKKVGKKTVDVTEKAVGHVDITCDNCGKLMKPGGIYTRTIRGKEYQFCSVLCADHFHPPM